METHGAGDVGELFGHVDLGLTPLELVCELGEALVLEHGAAELVGAAVVCVGGLVKHGVLAEDGDEAFLELQVFLAVDVFGHGARVEGGLGALVCEELGAGDAGGLETRQAAR